NPFGNGHINATYKVEILNSDVSFILQKINTNVFTNPQNIVHNHLAIQKSIIPADIEIPHLIRSNKGKFLYLDENHNIWRMMNFIKNSYSVEIVEDRDQAYEAGKGFGWFLKACSGLNPSIFYEAIQDFHSLTFRLNQLNEAITKNKSNRVSDSKSIIGFYKEREHKLLELEESFETNKIPVRVVHNDTKINNLLYRNKKAIAVIDLDTVGPGNVFFDYGDAIRTITNTADEDEKDLSKVDFNLEMFESFTKGYLLQTKSVLVDKELNLLAYAPFYMTFIIGIRFLSDYLNGDIYYKTKYPKHNLTRSLVQRKLIEKMESKFESMQYIIEKYSY
ncbi:MAG: aminoglycoside phosphotransferase, partial [Marinilabiliales bacterium]